MEAAFLGGLIGLERERNNQPAGLRTHIILCLGSALIMEVSIRVASGSPAYDPGRIAAQVVSGIGFLGAGYHLEAISVVIIMLLSLSVLKKVGRRLSSGMRFKLVEIQVKDANQKEVFQELEDILSDERCDIREMDVKKDPDGETMRIRAQITTPRDFEPAHLVEALTRHRAVSRAEVR